MRRGLKRQALPIVLEDDVFWDPRLSSSASAHGQLVCHGSPRPEQGMLPARAAWRQVPLVGHYQSKSIDGEIDTRSHARLPNAAGLLGFIRFSDVVPRQSHYLQRLPPLVSTWSHGRIEQRFLAQIGRGVDMITRHSLKLYLGLELPVARKNTMLRQVYNDE